VDPREQGDLYRCASLRAATGKAAKLRAINVRVTDAVVD
jgi:hypothetical protein